MPKKHTVHYIALEVLKNADLGCGDRRSIDRNINELVRAVKQEALNMAGTKIECLSLADRIDLFGFESLNEEYIESLRTPDMPFEKRYGLTILKIQAGIPLSDDDRQLVLESHTQFNQALLDCLEKCRAIADKSQVTKENEGTSDGQ